MQQRGSHSGLLAPREAPPAHQHRGHMLQAAGSSLACKCTSNLHRVKFCSQRFVCLKARSPNQSIELNELHHTPPLQAAPAQHPFRRYWPRQPPVTKQWDPPSPHARIWRQEFDFCPPRSLCCIGTLRPKYIRIWLGSNGICGSFNIAWTTA